ncbi:RNA-binding protein [Catellatospora methionotrophica]|uniref:RNA-binding protein n=1 Tax=Catellatospora methionotrophica TaxID=121620 RepID=A0A8J3PG43_9ACTN|nr:CRTAC1 family protein [Catellatospora methionotrophica]GIG15334.1 RNA-binding protein [Catellatospora methionotrophica]
MSQKPGVLRRLAPAAFVLALVGTLFVAAQLPEASAADRADLASRFTFTEQPIALPPGLPENHVREVNPKYEHIKSWVSSVGAAISVNDLDGGGKADDLCLVDTRTDAVVVTPAPGSGQSYAPFVLDTAPLPISDTSAPMGCVPGDFNLDGWNDLLVYYWGRTPVLFIHNGGRDPLARPCFTATELLEQLPSPDGKYHGKLWNTNAVAVADFDGDGHADIGVFNYFPDTQVLDPNGQPGVQMNHSMSRAQNAGGAHIMRWVSATAKGARFEEQVAIAPEFATGWTLGAASADLDGDQLPELYLANDFGNDRMFHNVSTPGKIKFKLIEGSRGPFDPKSLVLGHDSFKGMSIEFGDLASTGRFDMFVSNITAEWGLEESNMVWRNDAADAADARARMSRGDAPFVNKASAMNMAWVGWGWDAKMADFDNSGRLAVVQACGFVKGTINRFNWLQELAMTNDLLLQEPDMWPKAMPGDDISGSQPIGFWVREDGSEKFVNLADDLGLGDPTPSRGIAVADVDNDGDQDLMIARQWGAPQFFRNDTTKRGDYLGLRLYRPTTGAGAPGTPAYGAVAKLTTADGATHVAQLDGGGGHSGKRSFEVFFGLGNAGGKPVSVELSWRDLNGNPHSSRLDLAAGWHDLTLTDKAQEVAAR